MKVGFFGHGARGLECLKAIVQEGYEVTFVVTQVQTSSISEYCNSNNINNFYIKDVNTYESAELLRSLGGDLYVVAGFSQILKEDIFNQPTYGTINLHGGKLPHMRGSSPMNWAILKGMDSFSLSIIRLNRGVDTGDLLSEKSFSITEEMSIGDLHKLAERHFPAMLKEVMLKFKCQGNHEILRQFHEKDDAYFPLRFPSDGFVLFDFETEQSLHRKIRALTRPAPGAFTFYNGKKVYLWGAKLTKRPFFSEPGRIYQICRKQGVLVGTINYAIWITDLTYGNGASPILDLVRYSSFTTIRGHIFEQYEQGEGVKC